MPRPPKFTVNHAPGRPSPYWFSVPESASDDGRRHKLYFETERAAELRAEEFREIHRHTEILSQGSGASAAPLRYGSGDPALHFRVSRA